MLLPVEIVEEAEQVEGQLDPSLPLALVQGVRVHDRGGVIQTRPRHNGSLQVSGAKTFVIFSDDGSPPLGTNLWTW